MNAGGRATHLLRPPALCLITNPVLTLKPAGRKSQAKLPPNLNTSRSSWPWMFTPPASAAPFASNSVEPVFFAGQTVVAHSSAGDYCAGNRRTAVPGHHPARPAQRPPSAWGWRRRSFTPLRLVAVAISTAGFIRVFHGHMSTPQRKEERMGDEDIPTVARRRDSATAGHRL